MKENLNKNMFRAIWMINVCDISIQLAWLRGEPCGAMTSWKKTGSVGCLDLQLRIFDELFKELCRWGFKVNFGVV